MRLAIIDLGTNSVRFDVHRIEPGHPLIRLHREKIMVRLGEGAFIHGKLDRQAAQRTLYAFLRFKAIADQLHADKILAFGTAALREVADREKFIHRLKHQTGIDLRVLSGLDEAKLIALGVLANENITKGKFALIDIGGGSIEISICREKAILHSVSFPLGVARLQQLFLKGSPPLPDNIKELRSFIQNTIQKQSLKEHWPKVARIYGSSGTIRALAKILKKIEGENHIDRVKLGKLTKAISTMSLAQIQKIPGLEPKRADLILAGAILLEECMHALKAKKTFTTDFSLRDGILEEELKLLKQGKSSHVALHLEDLYRIAKSFGRNERHLKRMVRLTETLFERLRSIHKLKPHWQIYLIAAVILKNTGEAISLARSATHSYYIVKNADLPPMEEWETEFIAQLCLHQKNGKLDSAYLSPKNEKSKRVAFLKLLALLRVIDALDSGAESQTQIKTVQIRDKKAILWLAGRKMTGLEALNLDRRKSLFSKVFRRDITAVYR